MPLTIPPKVFSKIFIFCLISLILQPFLLQLHSKYLFGKKYIKNGTSLIWSLPWVSLSNSEGLPDLGCSKSFVFLGAHSFVLFCFFPMMKTSNFSKLSDPCISACQLVDPFLSSSLSSKAQQTQPLTFWFPYSSLMFTVHMVCPPS